MKGMVAWLWLIGAISFEILATSLLKLLNNHFNISFIAGIVLLYVACYSAMSQALKVLPTSMAYAIWSGAGIVALAIIDHQFYHVYITWQNGAAMTLIIIGIAWMAT